MNGKTRSIAAAAITGAAYAVLTVILAPISFGAVQFRISEALCILPFFLPSTAWGLFIGCVLANLFSGNLFDVIFGSAATLVACLAVAAVGKRHRGIGGCAVACALPVIVNALVIGAVITRGYNGLRILENPGIFALNALQVGIGEAAVMFLLGLPLMLTLPKKDFFREFLEKFR